MKTEEDLAEDKRMEVDYSLIEEQVMKEKTPKKVYLFSYFVSLGGFLMGYNSVSASGSLTIFQSLYDLNNFQVSFIISSYIFGGIFGALFSGFLAEKIGLKKTIFVASIIFILQSIFTTFALGYNTLILGRILAGVASGIASSSIPLYISEISTSEKRGQLTNSFVLFVTMSQFAAYLFTAIFANVSHNWRYIFGISFIPALVLFVTCFFLPESVRLLLRRKMSVVAMEELKKVRENESIVKKEILLIKRNIEGQSESYSIRSLFVVPSRRKALLYSTFLVSFSQFVGINAVMYFTPSILNSVGFSQKYVTVLSLLPSGINFLMTFPSLFLVDKFGRRKLFLFSCSGVMVALLVLVFAFRFQVTKLILFGLAFYIFNFAVGFGPLPGLISAELNTSSLANAISATAGWVSNFIVSSLFLMLVHAISIHYVFLIFFGFALVSLLFLIFLLPETSGKSKEAIESMLDQKRLY
eukprot:TRINITY_DN2495_c0_g1_i1.p1 TRINITY_DN2495_c0_g1~~TRINITY_DN2495_c0_g1_i1.p1  ORF type:complete len:549 (-),score=122.86 TRINITY_DN2495_c0_g1_i1:1474-2883(-)